MTRTTLRLPLLVAAALLAGSLTGCRTAGVGNLAADSPRLPSLVDNMSAEELLAQHNANAEKVFSIEAQPSMTVTTNGRQSPGLSSHLALERPKNLKLQLDSMGGKEADLGSNDSEFWFWVKRNDARTVFFCNYDENGDSPLTSSMQPDWIIEAMGLRAIPTDEIAKMTVKKGDNPGEAVLSMRQTTPQGMDVVREMVISETTKQVRAYRLMSADKKQLLADATIDEYGYYNLPATGSSDAGGTVYLPKRMRLNWIQERISLDVQMKRDVKINSKIDAKRRASLFMEPDGLARVDLAKQAGIDPKTNSAKLDPNATTTRDTLSPPPPRVKLSAPTSRKDRDTRLAADIESAELAVRDPLDRLGSVDAVVVPSIPTIDEPRPLQLESSNGWRGTFTPVIER